MDIQKMTDEELVDKLDGLAFERGGSLCRKEENNYEYCKSECLKLKAEFLRRLKKARGE